MPSPPLSPDDYQRASDLFNDLSELPAAAREARLDGAQPEVRAEVRAEVRRLLEAEQRAGGFLVQNALADAALTLKPAVTAPSVVAHYKVLAKLGEGGMGEVWRAYDNKLGRDVAIKFLPGVFAGDADRVARFEQEALVLASLNHPNIGTIYGVEEGAIVMELVEGPTLAERIAAGPVPWVEAREIAVQIAAALEAAHEKGVVHRDLKPANIKITPEGRVKVLDFGLAKPLGKATTSGGSPSPTALLQGTMAGMILGTAAYIAPEQAKGHVVDRRADVWAFGVVLYEMLTGRNPFQAETVAETLAAVLTAVPDLSKLPAVARPVVERCLRRDSRRRWQWIGDARIAIEEGLPESQPGTPASPKRWLPYLGGAAAVVLGLGYLLTRREEPLPPAIRFTVNTPGNGIFPLASPPRVSPNGEMVAFVSADPADQIARLYLYNLSKGTTMVLAGSQLTRDAFWSPDSRSLLLKKGSALTRIEIDSGLMQALPFESGDASWGPDGVVEATREGLVAFRPEAAAGRLILKAAPPHLLVYPTVMQGGPWMVYNTFSGTPATGVAVTLATRDGGRRRELFKTERAAMYAGPGYLLWLKGNTLMARAIDAVSGDFRSEAAVVAGAVERPDGSIEPGMFSASNNGVLAFHSDRVAAEAYLVWFDRTGKRLGTVGGAADYSNPALSPDGNRLAVSIRDAGTGKRNIWILALDRGSSSRITFDGSDNTNPVWSPDGARIAFSSDRKGARDLYLKNASGAGEEELLLESAVPKNAEDWSQDGKWLAFNEAVPHRSDDLVTLSWDSHKPVDFLRTKFGENRGRFSPDGRWLAYQSDETGRPEVYVQAFPPIGVKWQISNDLGGAPLWRGDGREMYYATVTTPSRIMAVAIDVKDQALVAGVPQTLFETPLVGGGPRNRYVVARDGQKFLALVPAEQKPVNSFTVVVNWPSLLKNR